MKALIDTIANTLLERKAKTPLNTPTCVEAVKLHYTLADTVSKTETEIFGHTMPDTLAQAKT